MFWTRIVLLHHRCSFSCLLRAVRKNELSTFLQFDTLIWPCWINLHLCIVSCKPNSFPDGWNQRPEFLIEVRSNLNRCCQTVPSDHHATSSLDVPILSGTSFELSLLTLIDDDEVWRIAHSKCCHLTTGGSKVPSIRAPFLFSDAAQRPVLCTPARK